MFYTLLNMRTPIGANARILLILASWALTFDLASAQLNKGPKGGVKSKNNNGRWAPLWGKKSKKQENSRPKENSEENVIQKNIPVMLPFKDRKEEMKLFRREKKFGQDTEVDLALKEEEEKETKDETLHVDNLLKYPVPKNDHWHAKKAAAKTQIEARKRKNKPSPQNQNNNKDQNKYAGMADWEIEIAKLNELQVQHQIAMNQMNNMVETTTTDIPYTLLSLHSAFDEDAQTFGPGFDKIQTAMTEPVRDRPEPPKPPTKTKQSMKKASEFDYQIYHVKNPINAITQALSHIIPDIQRHLTSPNSDHQPFVSLVSPVEGNTDDSFEEVEVLVDPVTGEILDSNSLDQAFENNELFGAMAGAERGLIDKYADCKDYGICNSTTKKQKKRKKSKINSVNKGQYNKFVAKIQRNDTAEEINNNNNQSGGGDVSQEMVEDFTAIMLINLQQYGCWCPKLLMEKSSDALMGHPIDGLDKVCRDWFRCKRCASLEPYYCPIKKDYSYDVTHFNNAGAISCENIIDDDCAYYNCLCDSEMALDIVANIGLLDVQNIGIDVEDCVRPENVGGHVIDSCCVDGDFPFVKPYSSDDQICVAGQVKDLTYF